MTDSAMTTVTASFAAGVALGGLLVGPTVADAVRSAPDVGSLGAVGTVLVTGTLALVLLVLGVFFLYLMFLYFE